MQKPSKTYPAAIPKLEFKYVRMAVGGGLRTVILVDLLLILHDWFSSPKRLSIGAGDLDDPTDWFRLYFKKMSEHRRQDSVFQHDKLPTRSELVQPQDPKRSSTSPSEWGASQLHGPTSLAEWGPCMASWYQNCS